MMAINYSAVYGKNKHTKGNAERTLHTAVAIKLDPKFLKQFSHCFSCMVIRSGD